jgi:hypothetical protein
MSDATQDKAPEPESARAPEAPKAPEVPSDDAILEALESGATPEEAIKPAPAPTPEPEPETADPEPEPEAPAAQTKESESKGEKREVAADDLEKALAALRRDGYPKHVIETIGDEQVVELGLKRAKVQADYDRAYSKASDLEQKLEELEAAKAAAPEPTTAEPVGNLAPLDLSELLNPIEDLLGEDGKKAFDGLGKALQAQASKAVQEATGPLAERIDQISAAFYTLQEASAKEQLASDFPGLSDPDVYGRVRDRMARMAANGEYDDMHSLMRDAAKIEFFDHKRPETKAQDTKRKDLKRNGTPSPDDRRKIDVKAMTPADREDAILEAIEAGDQEALKQLRFS